MSFKTIHNKQYKDAAEEVRSLFYGRIHHLVRYLSYLSNLKVTINVIFQIYRVGVFEANLKIIEQHNQEYEDGKHTWTMGVNHLADLTHKEFMVRNQLKVPELPERKTKYTIRSQLRPFSIDWRERVIICLLYTSPSPRDATLSRMPSSA